MPGMFNLTYPFDSTGQAVTNRITNEFHTLALPGDLDFHFIVPRAAPFYTASVRVWRVSDNAELVNGQHFQVSHLYTEASRSIGMGVAGSITFTDRQFAGQVRIQYQTIGGEWVIDEAKITEILLNIVVDPRVSYWEQVAGYPERFPVVNHDYNIGDWYGASEMVEQLAGIEQAIRATNRGNTTKGRYELPPIRAVFNNAGNLITVTESWTHFASIDLLQAPSDWVPEIAFRLIGGRANGVGTESPDMTCYVLLNRLASAGAYQIDHLRRTNHTSAAAMLRVYGRVMVGVDEQGAATRRLELWLRDPQLRSSVQVVDLTESRLMFMPVSYISQQSAMILNPPTGVIEFT